MLRESAAAGQFVGKAADQALLAAVYFAQDAVCLF